MIMTWDEARANSDKLTNKISEILDKKKPKTMADVYLAVRVVDEECGVMPNPNQDGQVIQLILYPSNKWQTWSQTSMSVSKYNIYI